MTWQAMRWVITGLVVLRMLLVGFRGPPDRILSWPMFSRGGVTTFELFRVPDGHEPIAVNPYAYINAGDYGFDVDGVVPLLLVLRRRYPGQLITGRVLVRSRSFHHEFDVDEIMRRPEDWWQI